jgi:hypothetical protein
VRFLGEHGSQNQFEDTRTEKTSGAGETQWEDRGPHGSLEPMLTPEENTITGADPGCMLFTREPIMVPRNVGSENTEHRGGPALTGKKPTGENQASTRMKTGHAKQREQGARISEQEGPTCTGLKPPSGEVKTLPCKSNIEEPTQRGNQLGGTLLPSDSCKQKRTGLARLPLDADENWARETVRTRTPSGQNSLAQQPKIRTQIYRKTKRKMNSTEGIQKMIFST